VDERGLGSVDAIGLGPLEDPGVAAGRNALDRRRPWRLSSSCNDVRCEGRGEPHWGEPVGGVSFVGVVAAVWWPATTGWYSDLDDLDDTAESIVRSDSARLGRAARGAPGGTAAAVARIEGEEVNGGKIEGEAVTDAGSAPAAGAGLSRTSAPSSLALSGLWNRMAVLVGGPGSATAGKVIASSGCPVGVVGRQATPSLTSPRAAWDPGRASPSVLLLSDEDATSRRDVCRPRKSGEDTPPRGGVYEGVYAGEGPRSARRSTRRFERERALAVRDVRPGSGLTARDPGRDRPSRCHDIQSSGLDGSTLDERGSALPRPRSRGRSYASSSRP